jgi:hypothetical protein
MSALRQASAALCAFGIGVVLIGTACSPSGAAGSGQPAATATSTPAPRTSSKGTAMSASRPCGAGNLQRSRCMIELILADVEQTHGAIDGGGISQIKATSSTGYAVSLPLEERVETVTYEFEVKDGSVAIKNKSSATKSYG